MLWDLNLLVNYNRTDTRSGSDGDSSDSSWDAGPVPDHSGIRTDTHLSRQSPTALGTLPTCSRPTNSLKQSNENLLIDVDNRLRDVNIKKEQVKLSREALRLSPVAAAKRAGKA